MNDIIDIENEKIVLQAKEMIDDTLPPDKMRAEIDEKEMMKAQEKSLMDKLNKISQKMEEEEEDPFLNDSVPSNNEEKIEEVKKEEDPFLKEEKIEETPKKKLPKFLQKKKVME